MVQSGFILLIASLTNPAGQLGVAAVTTLGTINRAHPAELGTLQPTLNIQGDALQVEQESFG